MRGQSKVEHLEQVAQWIADSCRKWGISAIVLGQLNQDKENTRWGEGLNQACDQLYALREVESDPPEAWMEMRLTRYTPYRHVGSDAQPHLQMNLAGPYFEDISDTGGQQLKMKGVN